MVSNRFSEIWNKREETQPRLLPVEPDYCCVEASRFRGLVTTLLERLVPEGREPTKASVREARLVVTEQFWNARAAANKPHRDRVSDGKGRLCLYGEWLAAMEKLHLLESTLVAPLPMPKTVKRPEKEISLAQVLGIELPIENRHGDEGGA